MRRVEMTAVAADRLDPIAQIRHTLSRIRSQLAEHGGRADQLESMTWTAERSARFHLARREVDLAYREVFSGNRPPITLRPGSGPLTVHAIAAIEDLDDSKPVWGKVTASELARQVTPRSGASMDDVYADWRERSSAFRASHPDAVYDLYYGRTAWETLDLFYPSGIVNPPLWVFIHGGAHQNSDKSNFSHLGAAMLRRGYAVAMPNYALCPDVTLATIVEQMTACMKFLHREADALEFDRDEIHIAGSSAGAHLAAWLASCDELPFIRSTLPMSGIMNLQPKWMVQGRILGIRSEEECRRLSPLFRKPNPNVRVGVAVGALESDEFRSQSAQLAKAWNGALLEVPGKSHFDVKEALEVGGLLHEFAVQTAQLASPRAAEPKSRVSPALTS